MNTRHRGLLFTSRAKASKREATPGASPSVLILDDQRDVSETVAVMVETLGGSARVTDNVEDFFAAWDEMPPEVAIIDLQMPGRDGLDVLRELGGRGSARVILTSGCDSRVLDAARESARANGLDVVGILPKPARRSVLRQLLEGFRSGDVARFSPSQLADAGPINAKMLEAALSNGEIRLSYQPKIRLRDHSLDGFEAIARWEHPILGVILPDIFFPLAVRSGLDRTLAEVMIGQALAVLGTLEDPSLKMSVKTSLAVCAEPGFARFLARALEQNALNPAHLILEICDGGSLDLGQYQIDALTRLRMQGVCLSLDEVGIGSASLERLLRVPFNALKIGRAFVRDLCGEEDSCKLVRKLVRLAEALDMTVTIDGIDTEAAMKAAEDVGCRYAQGYRVARPLSEADIGAWIAAQVSPAVA